MDSEIFTVPDKFSSFSLDSESFIHENCKKPINRLPIGKVKSAFKRQPVAARS